MKYRSTRGGCDNLSFLDALLMGLAPDGGLLVPEETPQVETRIDQWRELGFVALAKEIIGLFVDDIPTGELHRLIDEAYATFEHDDVVGMEKLGEIHLLELYHGPTLAFKDVALQLLGRLFEYALSHRGQRLTI